MNSLDTGKDKIKKICEILEKETLAPAKQEAANLLENTQAKCQQMLVEAKEQADALIKAAKVEAQREQELFEQNIRHGFAGAKERLRQEIEKSLLNQTLVPWVKENTRSPDLASKLITCLIQSIEKEGIHGDISAAIAEGVSASEVNRLLGAQTLQKLKEKEVIIGAFHGGVQLRLHNQNLILDLSDEAIVELLVGYIAKGFRDVIFE